MRKQLIGRNRTENGGITRSVDGEVGGLAGSTDGQARGVIGQ